MPQTYVIPCAQNIRSGASSYDHRHTVVLPLVRHPRRRVRQAAIGGWIVTGFR
jgi:hypothetical protein